MSACSCVLFPAVLNSLPPWFCPACSRHHSGVQGWHCCTNVLRHGPLCRLGLRVSASCSHTGSLPALQATQGSTPAQQQWGRHRRMSRYLPELHALRGALVCSGAPL